MISIEIVEYAYLWTTC